MTSIKTISPDSVLAALGIELPLPPSAAGRYRPWMLDGTLLFVSGQLSTGSGGDLVGRLGDDATLAEGVAAARQSGLNLLSQIRDAAGGDLGRVQSVLKLNGFVRVVPGFTRVAAILDGCSDLLADILGDAAGHARAAIGVAELPRGCLVEIDAIVRLKRATECES